MNELEKENEMNTKKEKQPTFNNRGYIITIKILIWLGCFVSYVIVNTLFAALTGFMFGYGITIFFLLFGAKKLCDKWEENYIKKQNGVARRKKVVWQATPAILNSDIVNEQGEENKNNGLNEVGISDEKTYEVPVTAVSLSSELDYKNAKKVARQEFKNKKKELKSSYPKQKKNNFKNSTIVLSVLLAGATVINVVQFVYYNDKISNLKVR